MFSNEGRAYFKCNILFLVYFMLFIYFIFFVYFYIFNLGGGGSQGDRRMLIQVNHKTNYIHIIYIILFSDV